MNNNKLTYLQFIISNKYYIPFIISLGLLIAVLANFETINDWGFWVGIAITGGGLIVLLYKGFYQHWNDYKNNKTR